MSHQRGAKDLPIGPIGWASDIMNIFTTRAHLSL
jgi:hypothetical protein